MMKNIIGIINFNTLCKNNSSSFLSSKTISWEDHKKNILDINNINFRLNILLDYSLPNLINNIPENINFKIVILYSTLLDIDTINKINQYAIKYNNIILESRAENDYLDVNGSIKRALKTIAQQQSEILFCSFRLDDDDILSSQYLYNLYQYITAENLNKFISFSVGLETLWENNKIKNICEYNKEFIAIGLAHIGLYDSKNNKFLTNPETIYAGVNHFDIPQKFEYIIDESPYSFIYSRHKYQDTNIKYKFWNTNTIHNMEEVLKYFPSIKNV